jgi:hypothetical protein
MKPFRVLWALVGLIAQPVAPSVLASILNSGAPSDSIIPDRYIVRYRSDIDADRRRLHEIDVDEKARNANKLGIVDRFDIPGLQGYVVEMPSSELDILKACNLVCFPLLSYPQRRIS